MCKTLDKEIENFNKNTSNFQLIKTNLMKNSAESEFTENNNLLSDRAEDDSQKFKVSDKQIKYYEDIANYRKEKTKTIYSEVLLVNKISNDINLLTHQQDKKIEQIDDNIEPVLLNAKDTFKQLLQASENDKKFKNNNCCIIFIIVMAVLFLFLVLINMNRV